MVKKAAGHGDHLQLGNDASEPFMTRVANVLACVSQGTNNLTDIKSCNLNASTATGCWPSSQAGLCYDPTNHRYYLGTRVAQISSNPVTSHQYLIMAANPEMEQLAKAADETVTLSLMLGITYIPLHSICSSQRLLVLEDYWGTRPVVPAGSTDLVLLSQLKEKELSKALEIGKIWLGPRNNTIRDAAAWETQLAQIREAGYSVTRGEKVPGGTGISVPVVNYFCPVALTIIGPEYRLEPRLEALINKIVRSGKRLSKILAGLFP
jgi:IclR family acetate operon transcriptional repressor